MVASKLSIVLLISLVSILISAIDAEAVTVGGIVFDDNAAADNVVGIDTNARFWWRHINAYDTMQFSYCKRFCKICLTLSQVSRSFPEKDKKEIKDIIRPQTGSTL